VQHIGRQYGMAVFFGLIHGLGFANSIQFMLAASQSIGWPLFSFNLGLEAGQLVLVALLTTISWLLQSKWPQTRKYWIVSISLLALLVAGWMAISRWPL
jgi:HupE / UreJ protein